MTGTVEELNVNLLDIGPYRDKIVEALAYAGGTHTIADVEAAIQRGDAQLWPAPHSCVITEVDRQPRQTILHIFIAAGDLREIQAMESGILEWGRQQGCTKARLVGRKGWERSFLKASGWANPNTVILEKDL